MIGFSELIIPAIIILLVIVFGKKTFLNFYRDMRGIKKEMKEIDKELKE
jgi:Sec-independent protein translocase protein TatA